MKYVLIDLSYLAHRARHTTGELSSEDIPTGIMFGFFQQLYDICKNTPVNSNKVLIFTDSKYSYRSKTFPDYKRKRREQRTEEEKAQLQIMYDQINKLKRKILPKLGFTVYNQTGLESDDLIAYVAEKLTKKKQKGIIITSDGDLYQCITPYINWYDPGRELLMNENSFKEKYGVEAKEWWLVKALAGCSSDNVPGLKGVGEKGAIDYIKGEMPSHLKKYQQIANSEKEITKWTKLVKLPHEKTRPIKIKNPKYNSKLFFDFAKHYDIISYLEPQRRKQWVEFFKGELKGQPRKRKK